MSDSLSAENLLARIGRYARNIGLGLLLLAFAACCYLMDTFRWTL